MKLRYRLTIACPAAEKKDSLRCRGQPTHGEAADAWPLSCRQARIRRLGQTIGADDALRIRPVLESGNSGCRTPIVAWLPREGSPNARDHPTPTAPARREITTTFSRTPLTRRLNISVLAARASRHALLRTTNCSNKPSAEQEFCSTRPGILEHSPWTNWPGVGLFSDRRRPPPVRQ